MLNKEIFAKTYAQAFVDSYPQLPASKSKDLIEKAIRAACDNIKNVSIDGAAFKLTARRLGIKCTYRAFSEFFEAR